MNNKEAVEFLDAVDVYDSMRWTIEDLDEWIAFKKQARATLEQIEELKRLCKEAAAGAAMHGMTSKPKFWDGFQDALADVIDAIDGDPSELKKLAGEE